VWGRKGGRKRREGTGRKGRDRRGRRWGGET